jgi:hypothetical protein
MNILIAGDFCPKDRVSKLLEQGDLSSFWGDMPSVLHKSDYSIVNLEAPIVTSDSPKSYVDKINLKANSSAIDALKLAGFSCVTLANNHLKDFSKEGVVSTLKFLADGEMDFVGAGLSLSKAQTILYKIIMGKQFAIVNFCEHEFSIASQDSPGAAPLDLIDNYWQIKVAKEKSDYVIVIVHGGHEHYQLPSPRMKKTYQWFIDLGADVVVNHHQHCYSGYEIYKDKPIFYGLGNFCFDWNGKHNSKWNFGYMISLKFDEQFSFELMPYRQCDEDPNIHTLTPKELSEFNLTIEKLNAVILDFTTLNKSYSEYAASRYDDIKTVLSPYTNRILYSLCLRGLLPSFLSRKRLFRTINYIDCESHRDIVLNYLKHKVLDK